MTRIVTVLRLSGAFKPAHVWALAGQIGVAAPGARFICLSDDPSVPGYTPLKHDWPGWWAKMEIFGLKGPCLYMDLDSVVTGDLAPLLAAAGGRSLTVLRDFNWPQREVQSSLMAWSGDMSALYHRFAADPGRHMAENASPRWWGDQGFIERQAAEPSYWQDIMPGAAVSWKKHCAAGIPESARIVCFHGKPRPWEVPEFAGLYRAAA